MVFQVVVRGDPPPSLTWYHQDTPLTSDYSMELQPDGSLSITSSELRHTGVYTLSARNTGGSVQKEVRLTVRQEELGAALADGERVEVKPVPLAEFGEYVAQGHSNSNEIFKLQYKV